MDYKQLFLHYYRRKSCLRLQIEMYKCIYFKFIAQSTIINKINNK